MTRGIPKKRAKAEQLRKKRTQAASVLAQGAKNPPPAIPVAARRSKKHSARSPIMLDAKAMPGPLPPAHYPAKRVAIGKRQVPGGSG